MIAFGSYSQSGNSCEGEKSVINILNKPSGTYFLKIYSQHGITTKKIIKQ